MTVESVTQEKRLSPSREHATVDGILGKVCGGFKSKNGCGQHKSLADFRPMRDLYTDGLDCLCIPCRQVCNRTRPSKRKTQPGQPTVYRTETPTDRALVPVREYSDVPFCDAVVKGVQLEVEGQHKDYMGLTAMCQQLGVDEQAQRRRIEDHPVLARGMQVVMMATSFGTKPHYVLDRTLVPLWLVTFDITRLSSDIQPQFIAYVERAAQVLDLYFQGGAVPESVGAMLPTPEVPSSTAVLPTSGAPYSELLEFFESTGDNTREIARYFQGLDRFMQSTPAMFDKLVGFVDRMRPLAEAAKRRRNRLTYGWVYIVRDGVAKPPRYKIGMTQKEERNERIKEVEGQWGKGQAAEALWIETDNVQLEKRIHSFYKRRDKITHLGDEFYRLTGDDIACLRSIGSYFLLADYRDELLMSQIIIQEGLL